MTMSASVLRTLKVNAGGGKRRFCPCYDEQNFRCKRTV